MTYKEALKQYEEAKKAEYQATIAIKEAEKEHQQCRAKLPELYDDMIEATASVEAGNGKQSDAEDAKEAYYDEKSRLEELKTALDVARAVKPKRKEQVKQAHKQLTEVAGDHWRDKVAPLIERSEKAVQELVSVSDEAKEFREEIKSAGLQPYNYLPEKISVHFDTGGRMPIKPQQFLDQLENLKQ
jgi:chromosome segregation ATPase